MDARFLLLLSAVLFSEICSFTAESRALSASIGEPPSPGPVPDQGWVGTGVAEAPTITATRRVQSHHHVLGSTGGDVILGGFVMAFVAAILCYIRVTRKNRESHS
ncbi:hypothetical protein CDL15_Pgr017024 [Punica granatum]|uniref:Uncharacterized protein n=1 Tax=Punica granatum TaxID=22663 RepID=A0A218WYK1_PUNGR|nr:hypothetical protein CDL15_Pgr017024 [Punica granatum]